MSLRHTISTLAEEFANALIEAIMEMPVHELADFHNNHTQVRPKRLPPAKKTPKLAAPRKAPGLPAPKMPARGPGGRFLPAARKNALRQLAPKSVAIGNA
jgi:hypothetical protein